MYCIFALQRKERKGTGIWGSSAIWKKRFGITLWFRTWPRKRTSVIRFPISAPLGVQFSSAGCASQRHTSEHHDLQLFILINLFSLCYPIGHFLSCIPSRIQLVSLLDFWPIRQTVQVLIRERNLLCFDRRSDMCLDAFGCVFRCGRGSDFDEKESGSRGGDTKCTKWGCDLQQGRKVSVLKLDRYWACAKTYIVVQPQRKHNLRMHISTF